ncbi:hypothetical protein GQ54DRAFT_265511 [Martensiomyces pterosporus]|nr:hypothetical protein GQ54DRAFT_265511 [Martensiomyces pterosporus]
MARQPNRKRVRFAESSTTNGNQVATNAGIYNSTDTHTDEYDSDINDGLEADITSSRRRGRRVNLDGYGSDTSDQDEIDNLSDFSDDEEQKGDRSDFDGDGDDMFSDNADSTSKSHALEKKRKRYLDIDDIEGQEMSSTSRTEVDGADSPSGLDRKGKAPEYTAAATDADDSESEQGTKIEAFNMKDDLEEGKFDAQGNFVWNKKDPQAYQDGWLDGLSRGTIEKARESKEKQDKQQQSHEQGLSKRWDSVSNDDIIIAIINLLQPRETILNALARIGGPKKKAKKRWGKKAKGKAADAEADADSEKEKERKNKIEELTELSDQAMARGMVNIYDESYEQLVRQMRIAGRVHDAWQAGELLPTAAAGTAGQSRIEMPSATTNDDTDGDGGGLLDDLDDFGKSHYDA